jgi:predicted SnoaL-like aldol condensation-catalyzing enzyme
MSLTLTSLAACGGTDAAPGADAPGGPGTAAQEKQNIELVRRFYTEVIGQNNTGVVAELFASDYIQHDSSVANGPDGQIQLVENLRTKTPGLVATIKHIAADGDYVVVHWHASATPADERTGQAVSDLYRVNNGKIVEHWDAFQDVPAMTPSGNSMFSDLYQYSGQKPALTEEQEEANKTLAVTAYLGLFNDHDLSLLDKYWDPNYLQHNPWVPNGTDGLKMLIQSMPAGAGTKLQFAQTLADDDLVYTIALMSGQGDAGATMRMLTDIFRVVDDKIVEHWDVQ